MGENGRDIFKVKQGEDVWCKKHLIVCCVSSKFYYNIKAIQRESLKDTDCTYLAAEFCANMSFTNLALAPIPSVKAENESAWATDSFQFRNQKAAPLSRVMNNIIVILTGNYIRT